MVAAMRRGRRCLRWHAGAVVALLAFSLGLSVPTRNAGAFDAAQPHLVSAVPATWTPDVMDEPGSVRSLAEAGSRIVAGGNFSQVENHGSTTVLTRNNLFAFNKATGAVDTAFVPSLDGIVHAVVLDSTGTEVFAGGEFHQVDNTPMVSLAKLRLADGTVDSAFKVPSLDGRIFTMRLAGGWLYIGGSFMHVGAYPIAGLARLNPSTGQVDATFHATFSGTNNGGSLVIEKLDVSPNGSRLAAVGNFMQVWGVDRPQIALFTLGGSSLALANWETDRFRRVCALGYNSYLHDVEFSPDGSYFVVAATGGNFSGDDQTGGCDSASRWETGSSGTQLQPTWIDFTGNDTFWSTAITGSVVYMGGHNRWVNNSFGSDRPGAGAFYVSGLAALDPRTGVPFDWTPTRTTGVGVFDMLSTSDGLWVGHDTDWIGHAYHYKLAFFPLDGGNDIPNVSTGKVPGTLYQLGGALSAKPDDVLYRVNAGGPAVPATDNGPDWATDTSANPSPYQSGSTTAESWDTDVTSVSPTVPTGTPTAIFRTDRRGTSDTSEMSWSFPVPAGTPVEVRLYFANQDPNTAHVGFRDAEVVVDGRYMTWGLHTTPYDIVEDVGNRVGTMHAFDETSDGLVDVTLQHHTRAPILSAVEIVQICGARTGATTSADTVVSRTFDGSSVGTANSVATSGTSWGQVRGAYMLSGTLYTGWVDGHICAQSFDGSTFGAMQPVNLGWAGVPNKWAGELPSVSAMFFTANRVYYTRRGSSQLVYRYFSPEDNMVGAQSFTAQTSTSDIDFSTVNGMFLARDPGGSGDQFLYFTSTADGALHRITWTGAMTQTATKATISTPGVTWHQQGLVLGVPAGANQPNQPPHANLIANCGGYTCNFSSVGSADPDGSVDTYSWYFGDGTHSALPNPSHQYTTAGTYSVTLTVGDDEGATDSETQSVTVPAVRPPDAPTNVQAVPGDTSATISWTPPAGDYGGPVTSYVITPDSDCSGCSGLTVNAPATRAVVRGLANGTSYSFTVSAYDSDGSGPASAASNVVTPLSGVKQLVGDFNGDGRTDFAVFRPSTGYWYIYGQRSLVYGAPGDIPVPGDFNGDHKADIAVFRPSTGYWYVLGQRSLRYGNPGDIPVPADYNGDGRTDFAVFRPSTGYWYVYGQRSLVYGNPGDIPVPADYNGDRRADFAVFRPSSGYWYRLGQSALVYGKSGDIPVPADYNGDGRSDIAVFRPATDYWYRLGQRSFAYGASGDVPVPGPYLSAGSASVAVFRPTAGTWWVHTQDGFTYGSNGDLPS